MKILKFITFGICLFFAFNFFIYSQENLAQNGDFEDLYMELPLHWTKEAWQKSGDVTKYYIETDNPHSGNYYVTIENIQNNDARLVQNVRVKPFTCYRLSCWVKASGVNRTRLGANLSVMYPDLLSTSRDFKDTNGEWEYIEYHVRTGAKQENMRVAIRLGGFGNDNAGKASFDDFRLEEVTDTTGIEVVEISKDDGIGTDAEKGIDPSLIFIAAAIFILVCTGGFFLYIFVIKPRLDKSNTLLVKTLHDESDKVSYTRKDWILAGSLTIIYAIVAFINLGSTTAPQTYWKPVSRGEDIIADLGQVYNVRRIYYYMGLPGGHGPDAKYEVDYSLDGVNWIHISTLGPDTIYYWYYKSTDVRARYMKITVEKPNSWLNEIVFTGEDIKKPLPVISVSTHSGTDPLSKGNIKNLFDEQHTYAYRPSHFTGMSPGYNEQYSARTALEHLLLDDPYDDTQPYLGKLLIALGILIFGMTPFGWRFMGTFFGILMIPVMYAFGKDLFKKKEFAFLAALFMSVDFMHFTQTRAALIDSFALFFIILMYFFMYKHYKMSFFTTDFKKTLIPLLLSGICVGLGCASKWSGVFAIGGLLIVGISSIIKKWAEYIAMKEKLSSESIKNNQEERDRIKAIVDKVPGYIRLTLLLSFTLFFVIIPAILYFLSYVPIWFVPAVSQSTRNPSIFHFVWQVQFGMYDYHKSVNVVVDHSFQSPWWEWPLMLKPQWYHVANGLPAGQSQRLFAFGNPVIWWLGSFAIIPGIIFIIGGFIKRLVRNIKEARGDMKAGSIIKAFLKDTRYKNPALFVPLVGFIFQYAVWIIAPRKTTFINNFFPSVPFIILVLVFFIKQAREKWIPGILKNSPDFSISPGSDSSIKKRFMKEKFFYYLANGSVYAVILLAVLLFIMFYPIIAGVPADVKYIQTFLKWLPGWYFA